MYYALKTVPSGASEGELFDVFYTSYELELDELVRLHSKTCLGQKVIGHVEFGAKLPMSQWVADTEQVRSCRLIDIAGQIHEYKFIDDTPTYWELKEAREARDRAEKERLDKLQLCYPSISIED